MSSKSFLICLYLGLSSCASTHPGQLAISQNTSQNLPLKISAENIEDPKGEAFQLIDLTFENLSDRWVKIHSIKVVTDDAMQISVVTGNDLKDWGKAMSFKLKKDEHNKSLAQTSLLLGGSVAMNAGNSSNSKALETAGAIAIIGTSAWVVGDVIQASLASATETDSLPENHISHPFSVPGKLFIRRWVLLNKPSDFVISKLVFAVETISGEKDSYEVSL